VLFCGEDQRQQQPSRAPIAVLVGMDGFKLGMGDRELRDDVEFELLFLGGLVLQHGALEFTHRCVDAVGRRRNETGILGSSPQRTDGGLLLAVPSLGKIVRGILHQHRVELIDQCEIERLATAGTHGIKALLQCLHVALGHHDIGRQTIQAERGLKHQQFVQVGLGTLDLGALDGFASRERPGHHVRGWPLPHRLIQTVQRCICSDEALPRARMPFRQPTRRRRRRHGQQIGPTFHGNEVGLQRPCNVCATHR